jgi:ATP-dependent DNA helicase RecQ
MPESRRSRTWERARPVEGDEPVDDTLFARLRALRKRLAEERGVPPYVVFHDRTLREMAASLPTSRRQLLRLTGVGQHKAEEFGDAFLAEVAAYVAAGGPADEAPPPPALRRPSRLSETVHESVRLHQEGDSIEAIAGRRGLADATIVGHLADALLLGEAVDVDRIIGATRRRVIEATLAETGTTPLKPALERLGDGYSYGELRLVQAALLAETVAARDVLEPAHGDGAGDR